MVEKKLVLENSKIIFRNFSGAPSQFNPEGKRNFCVLLDTDMANKLKLQGWNIRFSEGRDEDDEQQAYMQVAVSFDNYPPTIMMVTSKNKTILSPDDVGMLDWAEIESIDMIIRPYEWEVNGKTGVKAYLKSMYVKIQEDEFSEKYEDIPTTL